MELKRGTHDTHYANPIIHGAACGGEKKFEGSKQAQIASPRKKSCTPSKRLSVRTCMRIY
jgi:hypothetical protein